MNTPEIGAWYTAARRLMGRPEATEERAPMTGRDLGTGPLALERRPSYTGVAIAGILGLGLTALTIYLWVTGLMLIAIVAALVGLALAGAAVSGWRQNRAWRGRGP
ncbi:MAG: hypothetical protein ACRDHO_06940 [Actinomycetota bacterium]